MKDLKEHIRAINSKEQLIQVAQYYGVQLNRDNTAKCPFHNEKTASFHITDKGDGAFFKCFGCEVGGDIIEFIRLQENCSFIEALRKAYDILGLQLNLEYSPIENFIKFLKDKQENYMDSFIYTDKEGNPLYMKVKYWNKKANKKTFSTKGLERTEKSYRFSTDFDAVPKHVYNLPYVLKAIENEKPVVFVEGEKDCETLIRRGFTATTIYNKTWHSNYTEELQGADIVFIGDTGEAGEKFKKEVWNNLRDIASSFKVVNLPGLAEMGDNKDVTDWLEAGHTVKELRNIIYNRSLDLLNVHELQQDRLGIFKYAFDKKGEQEFNEDGTAKKIYLTNFEVIGASITKNIDNDDQTIVLKLRNKIGVETTVTADAREIFTDSRTFKKVIGIDNVFTGKGDDLGRIHTWIYNYFTLETVDCYAITGIRKLNEEYKLVTNKGVLSADGKFDTSIKANNDLHDIDFTGVSALTTEEANRLCKYLFNFNSRMNVYSTLGLGIAHMLNSFIRESVKDNLPILQITGQSNCGKSKTFDILRMLTGNKNSAINYGGLTKFTIMKILNDTYLPVYIEETKPACYPKFIQDQLTAAVRGMTEGNISLRGKKDQTQNIYQYNSTLLFCGEDELKDETAIKNRSNIVLYTEAEKSKEGSMAINYLCKSSEGRLFLHKLSYSLWLEILRKWSPKEIEILYDTIIDMYGLFEVIEGDRERNTVVYTVMGLHLLFNILEELGVEMNDILDMNEAVQLIIKNVQGNVFDTEDGAVLSELDKMILLIDEHIDPVYRANSDNIMLNVDYMVRDGKVLIDTTACFNKLKKLSKNYDFTIPLSVRAFRKHLAGSKYCESVDKNANTELPLLYSSGAVYSDRGGKRFRAYTLNADELKKLGCINLVTPDRIDVGVDEEIEKEFKDNVFQLKFKNSR